MNPRTVNLDCPDAPQAEPRSPRVHAGAADSAAAPEAGTSAIGSAPRRWSVPIAAAPVAAAAALLAELRLGATSAGLLAMILLPLLVVLAAIDLRWRIVPNRIVFPALAAVLVYRLVLAPDHPAEWMIAAIGAPLVLLMPALINSNGMGMGDVKLAALLGLALGASVLSALLVGSLAVIPVAMVILARGGRGARRTAIPFVPFLALGTAVVLLG